MQKQSFQIEFYAIEKTDAEDAAAMLIKYTALITVVSRYFQLFKVSGIKKIIRERAFHISNIYFLTSYPSGFIGELKWKDASTFKPTDFLQMVGAAIESIEELAVAEECNDNKFT